MADPQTPPQEDLPGLDEGTPEEQRLDALAPVDTEQLESSQRAIDEAKQAAEPVRRHQRDDADDEPEPAVTPDADIDESVEAVERQEEGGSDSAG